MGASNEVYCALNESFPAWVCLGLGGKKRLIFVIPDLNQGEISVYHSILDVLKYQPTVCNCRQEVPLQFLLREFARIQRLQNYVIYFSGDRHLRVVLFFINALVPLAVAPRWKDFFYNIVRRKITPGLGLWLDWPALLRVGRFSNVQ
jgi:hypothetical protein